MEVTSLKEATTLNIVFDLSEFNKNWKNEEKNAEQKKWLFKTAVPWQQIFSCVLFFSILCVISFCTVAQIIRLGDSYEDKCSFASKLSLHLIISVSHLRVECNHDLTTVNPCFGRDYYEIRLLQNWSLFFINGNTEGTTVVKL